MDKVFFLGLAPTSLKKTPRVMKVPAAQICVGYLYLLRG